MYNITTIDELLVAAADLERAAFLIQENPDDDKEHAEMVQGFYQWWNQAAYQLLPQHLQNLFLVPYEGVNEQDLYKFVNVGIRTFITDPLKKHAVRQLSSSVRGRPAPASAREFGWDHPFARHFQTQFRSQVNTLKEAREFWRSHKPTLEVAMETPPSPIDIGRSYTVFVGHGRGQLYLEVVIFLQKDLHLNPIYFESEATAGLHNIERIQEMLDQAGFAVLVATGDDEDPNGGVQARLNVIHEIGLFQGKLGFRKVAAMRQDGVREFSNLAGYQELRFIGNDVRSKFDDLRGALAREGMSPPKSA